MIERNSDLHVADDALRVSRRRGRPAEYRDDMRPFLELREKGATYASIARAIQAATGEAVAPTTVKRWATALADGRDPAEGRELPTATDRLSIHLTPEQRERLEDAVHLVRRQTGRQVKATAGTLARDLLQAAFERGLAAELAKVYGPETYARAVMGACLTCGSLAHPTDRHPEPRKKRQGPKEEARASKKGAQPPKKASGKTASSKETKRKKPSEKKAAGKTAKDGRAGRPSGAEAKKAPGKKKAAGRKKTKPSATKSKARRSKPSSAKSKPSAP